MRAGGGEEREGEEEDGGAHFARGSKVLSSALRRCEQMGKTKTKKVEMNERQMVEQVDLRCDTKQRRLICISGLPCAVV